MLSIYQISFTYTFIRTHIHMHIHILRHHSKCNNIFLWEETYLKGSYTSSGMRKSTTTCRITLCIALLITTETKDSSTTILLPWHQQTWISKEMYCKNWHRVYNHTIKYTTTDCCTIKCNLIRKNVLILKKFSHFIMI